jgi:hypothetical protein
MAAATKNGTKTTASPAKAESPVAQIVLEPIPREILEIRIEGATPLIVNQFSEKAKRIMLERMQGIKKPKEVRDPVADYEASIHRLTDGRFGFPAVGFKGATVSGARAFKGSITMAALRPMLYFFPDDRATGLIAIAGKPHMREDVVRNATGVADLRYRAEFPDWSATLRVEFSPHLIDRRSVLALVSEGGRNGIGEWRPEKGGVNGTYEVVTTS